MEHFQWLSEAQSYQLTEDKREAVALELADRFSVPTRVGRLYIPFGWLDNPSKLLSQVITNLPLGRAVKLSPCTQRRDFLGIQDVGKAWVAMARDLARGGGEIFNICSGEATELRALLLDIADAMEADPDLLRFGAQPMRPGEPETSFGDNAKTRRVIDWSPRPLNQAIREDLLNAGNAPGMEASV